MSLPYIEKLTWDQARNEVIITCNELGLIIDEINPANDYFLFKIRYPFGTEILKDVMFYIPSEKGIIYPITNSNLPKEIINNLNYSPLPLGIVIKNNIEVYRTIDHQIYSIAYYNKGLDLGIWEHFGRTTPYNVSAGARSLYMVPKISSSLAHKKIKKMFNVTVPPPLYLHNHWEIFKQIANSSNFPEKWFCETIFFTKKWVESIKNNEQWIKLQTYIYKKNWQHSDYVRKKTILDHTWDAFSRKLSHKTLKFNPYIVDVLKHLIFIGIGSLPASKPFAGDEQFGPLRSLQEVYENCYGLKDYIPTIMEPSYLSIAQNKPVYFSLRASTLLESVPRSKRLISTIDNIRELKELIKYFSEEIFDSNIKISNVPIIDMINNLEFEFFHNVMYAYGKSIRPTIEMPEKDKNLLYSATNKKNRKFADTGPYVQGCVRINSINKN